MTTHQRYALRTPTGYYSQQEIVPFEVRHDAPFEEATLFRTQWIVDAMCGEDDEIVLVDVGLHEVRPSNEKLYPFLDPTTGELHMLPRRRPGLLVPNGRRIRGGAARYPGLAVHCPHLVHGEDIVLPDMTSEEGNRA